MIKYIVKEQCCGCEACSQICPKHCISMDYDEEGFLYPKVENDRCILCGRCEHVCPINNETNERKPLKVFAAQNDDDKIRILSSSGGIFYLLAKYILEEEGIVFGAKFDNEWNVVHGYTDNINEIKTFMGSKYVQSKIGNCYVFVRKFLQEGRKVLFSGTPCQIKALVLFLNKEYENLVLVDIVCHGVPSPVLWQEYLAEESDKKSDIRNISFRYKSLNWENFHLKIDKSYDGESIEESEPFNNSIWGTAFVHNLFLRPSCYKCPVKHLSSGSDFTLGDFWGIDSFYPDFNDHKGTSLFIINTKKGESLLPHLSFKYLESSYDIGLMKNRVLNVPMPYNNKREAFYEHYRKHGNLRKAIVTYTKQPTIVVIKKRIKKIIKSVLDK